MYNPMYRGAWQATIHGGPEELDMTNSFTFELSTLLSVIYINNKQSEAQRAAYEGQSQNSNLGPVYAKFYPSTYHDLIHPLQDVFVIVT